MANTGEEGVDLAQFFVAVLKEAFVETSKECYNCFMVSCCNSSINPWI